MNDLLRNIIKLLRNTWRISTYLGGNQKKYLRMQRNLKNLRERKGGGWEGIKYFNVKVYINY